MISSNKPENVVCSVGINLHYLVRNFLDWRPVFSQAEGENLFREIGGSAQEIGSTLV